MALNFPNTPTNAQSYVDPNGHIWVYETATNSWTAQGAPMAGMIYKGSIDIKVAPPTGAAPPTLKPTGRLWLNTNNGVLYTYNGTVWVGQSSRS